MHVVLCDVLVVSAGLDEYVRLRRERVAPALAEQPGYQGSVLLRLRGDEEPMRLAILESWTSAEDQRLWSQSPQCAALAGATLHLVRGLNDCLYQRVDDVSITVGDPHTAVMCAIGLHSVVPGRGDEYLARRRDIANPSMRKAPGFVGISTYVDSHEPDRFLVFFQWESDATADAYYATPEHTGVIYDAINEVLTEPPSSRRHDVLLRHLPDGP